MPPTEKSILEVSRWIEQKLALINPSYLAPPDTEAIELRYMKKSEKSKVKLERKLKSVELKRKLLDPNNGKVKVADDKSKELETSKAPEEKTTAEEVVSGFEGLGTGLGTSRTATKDEMMASLKVKISEMRTARKASERVTHRPKKAAESEKKKIKSKDAKKRKLDVGKETDCLVQDHEGKAAEEKTVEEKTVDVEFGSVEDGALGNKVKKKKSKQKLLADVESRVSRKKQFESSGVGGEDIIKDEWEAALDRAQGEKVIDDPKVLRKNIHRADKKKAKSAREWKERIKAVEVKMVKKRDRAKANLKARTQKKMDRRKMKRLKKLMG